MTQRFVFCASSSFFAFISHPLFLIYVVIKGRKTMGPGSLKARGDEKRTSQHRKVDPKKNISGQFT
jgi:hypothetical protein